MDINKLLDEEDAIFEKMHSDKAAQKKSSKKVVKKKVAPKKKIRSLDEIEISKDMRNIDKERDTIINALFVEDNSTSPVIKTRSGKRFKRSEIERDLKTLMMKYDFNPNGQAEQQVIGIFIQNLYSTSLVKREF